MATASLACPRLSREIAAALDRGAQVLTANARSAHALMHAHAEDARALGLRSWRAPAIQEWTCWLQDWYITLAAEGEAELPLLLSSLQEEQLWKRVQAEDAALVVSPERLARLAQSGYALLSAYDAHSNRRAPWAAAHEDAERFLSWAIAFDELCDELAVLPCAELEARLREHLQTHLGQPRVAPELLLVGFDRLTPSQEKLLEALRQEGVCIEQAGAGQSEQVVSGEFSMTERGMENPASQHELICAADEGEELRACALWVRKLLEENPAQRIAVLVPELSGVRAEVDRVFRRLLLPESAQKAAGGPVSYEFSLGTPLASIPLVAAALLLLRWLAGPLPAAEVTSLLVSSFAAADFFEARLLAESDATLRRLELMTTELSMGSLLHQAEVRQHLLPASFTVRLREAEAWARKQVAAGRGARNQSTVRRRSHAEWAEEAQAQLAAMGWPGFVGLSSFAYQAQQRWKRLLAEVASLNLAGSSGRAGTAVSWSEFVQELVGYARNTLFAAESQDAPVQILGAAEAAGQSFDALWFLQVTEGRWPLNGRLHPLLAPSVQHDTGMPYASPEADRAFAEKQLQRIVASAPLVVCSYARQENGMETRPSPLLRGFAGGIARPAPASKMPWPAYMAVREIEPTATVPWPAERVAGGSEVLKRQAACGFQSFAKRLGAQPLAEESWGLDAGQRATLLHRALQELWSTGPVAEDAEKLHTKEDLERAIGNGSIEELLQGAVKRSFRGTMREATGDTWRLSYLELEQQRLCTRLRQWLDVEQDRAPFRVVGLEQQMNGAQIGELRLNLRADRVDELEDGRRLILDYKTAEQVNTAMWSGERPDEPQLPIYALFGDIADVAGVVFAQIRAGKTQLHGMAEDPPSQLGSKPMKESSRAKPEGSKLENPKPDKRLLTEETRAEWDRVLRSLAAQFMHGEAPVNPKKGEETCQFCGLYGLCRVRSQQGVLNGFELEDDLVVAQEDGDA